MGRVLVSHWPDHILHSVMQLARGRGVFSLNCRKWMMGGSWKPLASIRGQERRTRKIVLTGVGTSS